MGTSRFESLSVGNPESDHSRSLQSHGFYVAEVSLPLLVEVFLCAGDSCRRYHVDKSIGMIVDKAYAFFARFGSDEHYHFQVMAFGNFFIVLDVFFKRQIRNNDTVDTAFPT